MYLGKLEHGKVIRRLRMERNLTIEEVAELIDEDVKFLRDLENEMYPDIEIGILYFLAKTFGMTLTELYNEIEKENIDYINRMWEYERNKYPLIKQRDKQRKLVLQKKISHNFKNKHTKHPLKKKFNTIENEPTSSIMNICRNYKIVPK